VTPSAKKRKDEASARKAQKDARKENVAEISKKRSAMEQAKVSGQTKGSQGPRAHCSSPTR